MASDPIDMAQLGEAVVQSLIGRGGEAADQAWKLVN